MGIGGRRVIIVSGCRPLSPVSSAVERESASPGGKRILDLDFGGTAGRHEAWAELHQGLITTEQVNGVRKRTYAGRPFGEGSSWEKWRGGFSENGGGVARKLHERLEWMGGCPRREILKWAGQAVLLSRSSATPISGDNSASKR